MGDVVSPKPRSLHLENSKLKEELIPARLWLSMWCNVFVHAVVLRNKFQTLTRLVKTMRLWIHAHIEGVVRSLAFASFSKRQREGKGAGARQPHIC